MPLIETVLGNANDPEWRARLAHAHVDTLDLSQWDAQKSRLRKTTRDGLPPVSYTHLRAHETY